MCRKLRITGYATVSDRSLLEAKVDQSSISFLGKTVRLSLRFLSELPYLHAMDIAFPRKDVGRPLMYVLSINDRSCKSCMTMSGDYVSQSAPTMRIV